jgi:hypothetical protein
MGAQLLTHRFPNNGVVVYQQDSDLAHDFSSVPASLKKRRIFSGRQQPAEAAG